MLSCSTSFDLDPIVDLVIPSMGELDHTLSIVGPSECPLICSF